MLPAVFAALLASALTGACGSTPDNSLDGGEIDGAAGDAGADTVSPQGVDYLIVAADSLSDSAQRYRAYRESTGHGVEVSMMSDIVGDETDAVAATALIGAHVRTYYEARDTDKPFYLLILGDATTSWSGDTSVVPAGTYSDDGDTVTSDNVYADMSGDQIPDLAVGRIPASSDEQVDLIRGKVEAYESTYEVGPWNRRLNVFASTAGFGDPFDSLIENVAFDIVESVPYDFDITMTYASQESPFVYPPEKFSDKVYDRINEGALMVTYVGHGSTGGFASLDWNGTSYPILDTGELDKIDVVHKLPILLFVACSTGSFDTGESISEQIIDLADGPDAVLSSTEVSHPVANAIFIYEFSRVVARERETTVGEAFVAAKDAIINHDDELRQTIANIAGFLFTAAELQALERNHLHMYTLFGDPAMKIAYPALDATVDVLTDPVTAGGDLEVHATFTGLGTGDAVVTLESSRSVILGAIQDVPADGEPTRDDVIEANYATANNKIVAEKSVTHSEGEVTTTLAVPAGLAAGDYYVKVYADDGTSDAIGSAAIAISE